MDTVVLFLLLQFSFSLSLTFSLALSHTLGLQMNRICVNSQFCGFRCAQFFRAGRGRVGGGLGRVGGKQGHTELTREESCGTQTGQTSLRLNQRREKIGSRYKLNSDYNKEGLPKNQTNLFNLCSFRSQTLITENT